MVINMDESDTSPTRSNFWYQVLLILALFSIIFDPTRALAQTTNRAAAAGTLKVLQSQQAKLEEEFAAKLETLAKECETRVLPNAALTVRAAITPADRAAFLARPLPRETRAEIPLALPADDRFWQTQLRFEQENHAKNLYLHSRKALHAGFGSYALDLVREVAQHDPDNRPARKLLGYVQQGQEWMTPFEADMTRKMYVRHPQFGWILKKHVPRYENGERFVQSRWVSAEKEDEIRRDFRQAWEIRTEHFLIKTNHSLEKGVELGDALEAFYDFFHLQFAGFFNTPEQLAQLFDGKTQARTVSKPHVVHYYRTRLEYNERLKQFVPQIDITNGLYRPTERIAHFFHDPEVSAKTTLYHEATHQLLYEIGRDREIARYENFWIVEGIACYFESFSEKDLGASLGDPRFDRFLAARYRFLNDGYYLPLREMAPLGMQAFQSSEKLAWNYQQAANMTKYLMEAEGGRYRDAVIAHLSQIYSMSDLKRDSVDSIEELVGVPFEQLDAGYREFVIQQEELARSLPPANPAIITP
ncbi:hypothetical protein Spb1_34480 [Planctopirus ephydatiae]|uniref:DUF1570 domain-containing protein n=1 Tax=Planctopirus ephydatiae TaxID=2528019 RepID=A0A518GSE7_9PLAN|nr:DUF1570 domain-containing protein [Planctopirus ephydatiae]QDV31503.1 hypothetical protein Spb1_34480 [Planctopirus ephydatiae]